MEASAHCKKPSQQVFPHGSEERRPSLGQVIAEAMPIRASEMRTILDIEGVKNNIFRERKLTISMRIVELSVLAYSMRGEVQGD